ncbi:MAG TPA: hypothetical protein VJL87_00355 [Bdellovibrionota bacterium]|nr:hypothetical protein [Bdellovibrionota bacterium]
MVRIILSFLFLLIPVFAHANNSYPPPREEVQCFDGGTIQEVQTKMNSFLQQMIFYSKTVSAPALLLKHSGVENPYVLCVTIYY